MKHLYMILIAVAFSCLSFRGWSDDARKFRSKFKSLAARQGQRELHEYLKQDYSHRFDGIDDVDSLFALIRNDDEKNTLGFLKWMYALPDGVYGPSDEYMPYVKLRKALYKQLSSQGKTDAALVIAASQADRAYSSRTLKEYDFSFEREVFAENAAALREAYGCTSTNQLTNYEILGKFYGMIYNDVQRPRFDGMFGAKFGLNVDVAKAEKVHAFDFDFYRVPFTPEKKSKAFEYYDLWVSIITHKVFGIQGRSKSAIAWATHESGKRNIPPLVASLERKYQNMSVDIGPGWTLIFPVEKCSLRIIGNVKGCAEHRVGMADFFAMDAAFILGGAIGRGVMEKTFADANTIRASVSNYLMSDLDKEIGCTVVAESAELAALAKKESKIAEAEAKRESDLRKEIEAQNAADAF